MSGEDPKIKINTQLLEEYKSMLAGMTKIIDPKLTEITLLSDMQGEDQELAYHILTASYQSNQTHQRRFGSILNSCYTQGVSVFVLTKKIADDLCSIDPHYKPDSCNTPGYKELKRFFLSNNLIEELRKPERNQLGVAGKAGLYKLINKKFLLPLKLIHGDAALKAREEELVKWYDENNENMSVEETPEILEERRRMREKINERKNKT